MKNIIILFIGTFVLSSCGGEKIQEKETPQIKMETNVSLTDAQFKSAKIEIGKLEKREISTTLKLNGKIDVPPQNMISVSMPLGGFLKSTKLFCISFENFEMSNRLFIYPCINSSLLNEKTDLKSTGCFKFISFF